MTPSELKSARLRLGLTQEALAMALGVNPRTVAGWEAATRNGHRAPVPGPVAMALAGMLLAASQRAAQA